MQYDIVSQVLDNLESTVKQAERGVGDLADPVAKNAVRRFPLLFTLLVTFGVSSIFFGFERFLSEITILNDNPLLMIFLGVILLLCTKTLYKKL